MHMYWVALTGLVVAAGFDWKTREIPNTISAALIAVSLGAKLVGWHPVPWTGIGLGLVAAFAISLVMFRLGGLGGGDVKLLTALGGTLGMAAFLPFAIATGLIGGAAALFARMGRRGPEIAYAPVMLVGLLALLPAYWIGG